MIVVTPAETRSTSNNLEFVVRSGSNLKTIAVESYSKYDIKLKLQSKRLIEEYKAFCFDCFDEGSNFIREVEIAIQKNEDSTFEFDVNNFFYMYFKDNKDMYIFSKVESGCVNGRVIQA